MQAGFKIARSNPVLQLSAPLWFLLGFFLPARLCVPATAPGNAEAGKEERLWDERGDLIRVKKAVVPEHVPHELIVKFKPDAGEAIRARLNGRLLVEHPDALGLPSLDALNRKYHVSKMEPVFKALHRKLIAGKSLEEVENENQGKYPHRARRAIAPTRIPDLSRTYLLTLAGEEAVETAAAGYRRDPSVEYAEPNYVYHNWHTPNDPYYSSSGSWGQPYDDMWGLKLINIEPAWDMASAPGTAPVIVAVIDTGVDHQHPDLAANMWTNPGEIPNNGIDDDGNGYIDDYHGYNFFSDDGDTRDDNGHGTHVAGTIAAVTGNGIGIAGIALNARIMAVKGLGGQGCASTGKLAQAVIYATDSGADVQNDSWGGEGMSKTITEAMLYAYAHGSVLVVAAGNSNDEVQYYTPAYLKEVITVAAVDHTGARSDFSNYGAEIDVAAPGGDGTATAPSYPEMNILSLRAQGTDLYCGGIRPICDTLIVGEQYYRARGTSMASPHVAGLAALVLSAHPEFNNEQVRQAIRASVDDVGDPGFDRYYGYGRINAGQSLQIASPCTVWIDSPRYHSYTEGIINIEGTAAGTGFQRYRVEYGEGEYPSSFSLLTESVVPVDSGILSSWDTQTVPTGNYTIRLRVDDALAHTYEDKVLMRVDHCGLEDGWPYDVLSGFEAFIPPTLADLDGDGTGEIIAPTVFSKQIYVFAPDGTVADGWPVALDIAGMEISDRFQPPAVGDVDRDGKQELFLNTRAGVYGFDYRGQPLPGWPQEPSRSFSTQVVLSDLDRDGFLDIVCLSKTPYGTEEPARLFAWDRHGSVLDGFPVMVGKMSGVPNLAVGDIDPSVPGLEIVVPVPNATSSKIAVYDCRGQERAVHSMPDYVLTLNVSVGDVNHDGFLELVYTNTLSVSDFGFGVLDHDCGEISRLTLLNGRLDSGAPALEDIDGDGDLEVIASRTDAKVVYAWNYDGSNAPGWPIKPPELVYLPVVADVDGDGTSDIVSGLDIERPRYSHKLYAFHLDGVPVAGWPIEFYMWPSWMTTVTNFQYTAIGDIDGDGKLEMAASPGTGKLFVIELRDSVSPTRLSWPMGFHDLERSCNYHRTGPAPTLTPTPPGYQTPTPIPSATPVSPTPSPTPVATPSPVPSASPSPEPSATPSTAPTPTPSASPVPSSTPTPSVTPTPTGTPTPSPSATPSPTATATPSPTPSATAPPAPSPSCGPHLAPDRNVIASGDYDGDGAADIAVYRPAAGLWSVKGVTRRYFGTSSDQGVPGDYDGDGTTEIAVFRPASGLWSILGLTRAYFGVWGDRAVPSDYSGNGSCDIGIFRENGGLWSVRHLTRFCFGAPDDWPIPGDYNQDGISEAGLYRVSSGQWMIRGFSRSYFGTSSDWPVPGYYAGDALLDIGIFRPCSGMWAVKHLTRVFFGNCFDYPRPADFDGDGTDDVGIFRELSGMWAVRNLTRVYFGATDDLPVTR